MYEVREQKTDELVAKRTSLGKACDSADVFHIATGNHYSVVECRTIYTTNECDARLRPGAEMAVVIGGEVLSRGKVVLSALRRMLPGG